MDDPVSLDGSESNISNLNEGLGKYLEEVDQSRMNFAAKKSFEQAIQNLVRNGMDISNLREFAQGVSSNGDIDMVLEKFDQFNCYWSNLQDMGNDMTKNGDFSKLLNFLDCDKNSPQPTDVEKVIPRGDELGYNLSALTKNDENIPIWGNLEKDIPFVGDIDFSDVKDTVVQVGDSMEYLTGISSDELVSHIPGASLFGFKGNNDQSETDSGGSDDDFESIISDIKSIGGDFAEIITDSKQFFTQLGAFVGVFGTLVNTFSNTVDDYQKGNVLAGLLNLILLVSVHIPTMSALLFVFLKDKVHLTLKGFLKVKEDLQELVEDLESLIGDEDDEDDVNSDDDNPTIESLTTNMDMSSTRKKLDEWGTPIKGVEENFDRSVQETNNTQNGAKNGKLVNKEIDCQSMKVSNENQATKRSREISNKNCNTKKQKVIENELKETSEKYRNKTCRSKRFKDEELKLKAYESNKLNSNFSTSKQKESVTSTSTHFQSSYTSVEDRGCSIEIKRKIGNPKLNTPAGQCSTERPEDNEALKHQSLANFHKIYKPKEYDKITKQLDQDGQPNCFPEHHSKLYLDSHPEHCPGCHPNCHLDHHVHHCPDHHIHHCPNHHVHHFPDHHVHHCADHVHYCPDHHVQHHTNDHPNHHPDHHGIDHTDHHPVHHTNHQTDHQLVRHTNHQTDHHPICHTNHYTNHHPDGCSDGFCIQCNSNLSIYINPNKEHSFSNVDPSVSGTNTTFESPGTDGGDWEHDTANETKVLTLGCVERNEALVNIPWTVVISKKKRRRVAETKQSNVGHGKNNRNLVNCKKEEIREKEGQSPKKK